MVVFPEESKFYTSWQHDMESRGVKVRIEQHVRLVDNAANPSICRSASIRKSLPSLNEANAAYAYKFDPDELRRTTITPSVRTKILPSTKNTTTRSCCVFWLILPSDCWVRLLGGWRRVFWARPGGLMILRSPITYVAFLLISLEEADHSFFIGFGLHQQMVYS